jgi:CheY-like chemotaxis protein
MNTQISDRILIVEDQPNWQQVLSDTLRLAGYEVEVASTPREAKQNLGAPVRVIVLDMRLVDAYPYGLQGLEILGVAKQQGCKVIVLTGFIDPGLKERTKDAGADAFVQKGPGFDVKEFRELIAFLMQ